MCLFSLLLQASFWRLQIQFCGFLMLVVFFFFPEILLKAWDRGGALVLILVLPFQECCSFVLSHPGLSEGLLRPQDHVEVLLLILPEGSSQPGLQDRLLQQHLVSYTIFLCCLQHGPDAFPSPESRTGGDRQ